jgi:hypothetical protein
MVGFWFLVSLGEIGLVWFFWTWNFWFLFWIMGGLLMDIGFGFL